MPFYSFESSPDLRYTDQFRRETETVNETTVVEDHGHSVVVHRCKGAILQTAQVHGSMHFGEGRIYWKHDYEHCPNCGVELAKYINEKYEATAKAKAEYYPS